jgi:hypothetical protein
VRTFVWVDSWAQQCCGEPFRIGTEVRWQVRREDDGDEWATTLLGPEWGDRVRYAEDRHGLDESDGHEIRGVVRSIRVVTCDRVLDTQQEGHSAGVWVPVPGSGRLREVEVADPWEPEPMEQDPPRTFDGWIVEVDLVD